MNNQMHEIGETVRSSSFAVYCKSTCLSKPLTRCSLQSLLDSVWWRRCYHTKLLLLLSGGSNEYFRKVVSLCNARFHLFITRSAALSPLPWNIAPGFHTTITNSGIPYNLQYFRTFNWICSLISFQFIPRYQQWTRLLVDHRKAYSYRMQSLE